MTAEMYRPDVTTPPAATPVVSSKRPRMTLWLLRASTLLITIAILIQPVLAGSYMNGNIGAISLHSANAILIVTLALMVELPISVAYWLAGGRAWPVLASFALFMLVSLQLAMGYSRELAIHVPLGVSLAVLSVLFAIWTCRPAAADPRRPWGRRS